MLSHPPPLFFVQGLERQVSRQTVKTRQRTKWRALRILPKVGICFFVWLHKIGLGLGQKMTRNNPFTLFCPGNQAQWEEHHPPSFDISPNMVKTPLPQVKDKDILEAKDNKNNSADNDFNGEHLSAVLLCIWSRNEIGTHLLSMIILGVGQESFWNLLLWVQLFCPSMEIQTLLPFLSR